MVSVTEFGDVVFDFVDEYGNRKIDSLLEDGLRIFPLIVAVYKYNLPLHKRYVKIFVQVKRNGNIIEYCTPYIRFETERAIQT